MISKFTAKTIKKALEDEDFDYQYTTLIADKVRAIYTLFGWTHMLETFHATQDTIDTLLMTIYQGLASGKKEIIAQAAGIHIEGWIDEDDFVNLDYYFDLS